MKHIHTLLFTLVYSLSYLSVVEVSATDELIWDGKTKKQGKYSFFSPYNNNQTPIYKLNETPKAKPSSDTSSIIDPNGNIVVKEIVKKSLER